MFKITFPFFPMGLQSGFWILNFFKKAIFLGREDEENKPFFHQKKNRLVCCGNLSDLMKAAERKRDAS